MSMTEDDHRRRPRRRGEALVAAILEATIDELVEKGYPALTMESAAQRAGRVRRRFIGVGRRERNSPWTRCTEWPRCRSRFQTRENCGPSRGAATDSRNPRRARGHSVAGVHSRIRWRTTCELTSCERSHRVAIGSSSRRYCAVPWHAGKFRGDSAADSTRGGALPHLSEGMD